MRILSLVSLRRVVSLTPMLALLPNRYVYLFIVSMHVGLVGRVLFPHVFLFKKFVAFLRFLPLC